MVGEISLSDAVSFGVVAGIKRMRYQAIQCGRCRADIAIRRIKTDCRLAAENELVELRMVFCPHRL